MRSIRHANPVTNYRSSQSTHSTGWVSRYALTASPSVGKNALSPIRVKSPKRFSLSLTGSFISAKHNSMPAARSVSSSSRQHVGGRDVDARDRLGRDDEPAHRRRRARDGVEHAFVEQLGVGEEQRRIPAEQHEARDQARIRIAGDVVIALARVRRARARRNAAASRPRETR